MARNFLVYWTPEQIEASLDEGDLPHAAGGQLKRVGVGDRLWIVGRADRTPELFAIGYLDVAQKLAEKAAQAEMQRRAPGYVVWHAKWHVLAEAGRAVATKAVSLRPLYTRLSFESTQSPKLKITKGHPNAQQLQTIRRLTPSASEAMLALWSGRGPAITAARPSPANSRSTPQSLDLDELDAQRTVLVRLEQQAARLLLFGASATTTCAFCAREVPTALAVAAHIKPRANCSLEEKKAIDLNVIGLCKLGCDDLFERGFLEVVDGRIVDGPAKPATPAIRAAKRELVGRSVQGWTRQHEKFFRWRRAHRSSWWG